MSSDIGLEGLEDILAEDVGQDINPPSIVEKTIILKPLKKQKKQKEIKEDIKSDEEDIKPDEDIKPKKKRKSEKQKKREDDLFQIAEQEKKEKEERDEAMYGEALKEKEIFKVKDIQEKFMESTHQDIDYDSKCMNQINIDIFKGKKKKQVEPVQLREHQKLVIDHLLKHRGILAVHSTGTGKTLTAIGAINCILDTFNDPNKPNYIKRVIIVLPKSVQSGFEKEMKKFGLYNIKKYKDDLTPEEENMYKKWKKIKIYTFAGIVHAIKKNEIKCKNTFLIIDEVHNLKAEFKKGEFIRGTLGKIEGTNAYHVARCAAKASKVLLLTATPIMNNPTEIINYIAMIDGRKLQYGVDSKAFAKEIYENEDVFNKYFCCKVSMYLIEKDQNYPERLEDEIVKFVMDVNYFDKYWKIENTELEKAADRARFGNNAFQNAVRRASVALDKEDSPKIQWIYNFLKDEIQKNKKSIIYSQFIEYGLDSLRKILDANDIPYAIISGQIHSSLRKKFIEKFNQDKIKVLLISKAGGEGIDLKGVRNVILMESNWHEAGEEQVIGRAIRYKSHIHLPPEEQNVKIYRLWMVKPINEEEMKDYPEELKKIARLNIQHGRLAIDETIYYKSYGIKKPAIIEFYKKLDKISIENSQGHCLCKLDPSSPSIKEIVNEEYDDAFVENKEEEKAQQEDFQEEVDKEEHEDEFKLINKPPPGISEEVKELAEQGESFKSQEGEETEKEETEEEILGYRYEAPGKSSLSIQDVELTVKQFKNLTGLYDNKFYTEYYAKFKKTGEIKTKNKEGKTIVLEVYKDPEYQEKELDEILDDDELKMLEDATSFN